MIRSVLTFVEVSRTHRLTARWHGHAIINKDDGSVWILFSRPWWDLASWFWLWLGSGSLGWARTSTGDGPKQPVLMVRVAEQHAVYELSRDHPPSPPGPPAEQNG